ncbi:MAG: energy transducer TonB [Desulfatirhabdiaceae bacterium]|nr:energy transducer TonB [Desulfatirhabdiaceae bacterium]
MSARGSAHASLLLSSGTSSASIGWYVAASFAVHVLFFVIVTYLPELAPKKEFVPSVIMVNMVTMSPTGSIGKPGHSGPEKPGPKSEKPPEPKSAKPEVQESKPEPPAPKPAKPEVQEPKPVPPAPKPEKVSVPEPEKSADAISLSNEKPKIKTSLKKETFKSNQAIKNALNRIEKQVEETKPVDPLASALDRIKSKVEKAESETAKSPSNEPVSGKATGGAAGGSGGGTGGTGGTGAFGIQPIDFYKSLIPDHINNNWVFNEQLVGGRTDLVSVIVIKILKNGEITDIWFEKKSGNSYFDDSVYKAVKKSSPLPPLPREFAQPYYDLGLIFTPKGLKRS